MLDANPLEDILNTRKIAAVYQRGQELDRAALRAALDSQPDTVRHAVSSIRWGAIHEN